MSLQATSIQGSRLQSPGCRAYPTGSSNISRNHNTGHSNQVLLHPKSARSSQHSFTARRTRDLPRQVSQGERLLHSSAQQDSLSAARRADSAVDQNGGIDLPIHNSNGCAVPDSLPHGGDGGENREMRGAPCGWSREKAHRDVQPVRRKRRRDAEAALHSMMCEGPPPAKRPALAAMENVIWGGNEVSVAAAACSRSAGGFDMLGEKESGHHSSTEGMGRLDVDAVAGRFGEGGNKQGTRPAAGVPSAGAAAAASAPGINSLFQTASGKGVNVSERHLRRACAVLGVQASAPSHFPEAPGEEHARRLGMLEDGARPQASDCSQGDAPLPAQGDFFSPGAGNRISSGNQLCRAEQLQQGIPSSGENCLGPSASRLSQATVVADCLTSGAGSSLPLFQTASGRAVRVSAGALARAGALLAVDGVVSEMCDGARGREGVKGATDGQSLPHPSALAPDTPTSSALDPAPALVADPAQTTARPLPSISSSSLFQTASGRAVAVCPRAMARAARVFGDASSSLHGDVPSHDASVPAPHPLIPTSSPTSLFQTASGKAVGVTSASLARAVTLLGGIQQAVGASNNCEAPATHAQQHRPPGASALPALPPPTQPPSGSLFQTASGKGVAVIAASLARAAAVLGDQLSEQGGCEAFPSGRHQQDDAPPRSTLQAHTATASLSPTPFTPTFQRAPGESVVVSSTSLASPAAVLGDSSNQHGSNGFSTPRAQHDQVVAARSSVQTPTGPASCSASPSTSLFQTASGRAVDISPTSLARAAALLGDPHGQQLSSSTKRLVENGNFSHAAPPARLRIHSPPSSSSPSLFQTASGRAVSVSTAALARAQSLLRGNDKGEAHLHAPAQQSPASTQMPVPSSSSSSSLFQTASGRGVTLSASALARAQSLLREKGNDEAHSHAPAQPSPASTQTPVPSTSPSLFQTASGRGVTLSAASIARAEMLLSDTGTGGTRATAPALSSAVQPCFGQTSVPATIHQPPNASPDGTPGPACTSVSHHGGAVTALVEGPWSVARARQMVSSLWDLGVVPPALPFAQRQERDSSMAAR